MVSHYTLDDGVKWTLPFEMKERKKERKEERKKKEKRKKKERKKDILMSCKRAKWPIRPNKRLHLKCCLVIENNKSK